MVATYVFSLENCSLGTARVDGKGGGSSLCWKLILRGRVLLSVRVQLISFEPELERVCAAAMRSCYSPHPGYELFTYTSPDKALEGEKVFDQERISGLLKRSLELGHYDILEHNSITWLVEAEDSDIFSLMDSSKFFETSRIDSQRWIVTTNLRVLVELTRGFNQRPLAKELVATLDVAAPNISAALSATIKS